MSSGFNPHKMTRKYSGFLSFFFTTRFHVPKIKGEAISDCVCEGQLFFLEKREGEENKGSSVTTGLEISERTW